MIYVLFYLIAILAANLDIVLVQNLFGATDTVRLIITTLNAFVFIAFDITARDGLHEAWHRNRLVPKMTALIATGSLLTWALNRDAGQIALASFVAFLCAALVDTAIYHALLKRDKAKWIRINGSNFFAALVDSLLFPTIAFGGINLLITGGQFAAKVIGGFLWSLVLTKEK